MAKDNGAEAAANKASASGNRRLNTRSTPYDPNNSFVRKVATKVSDLIPQKSWISKWFNNSQDEAGLQANDSQNPDYENYEDKQAQPPPSKRPCIRMDVTHPPGTFSIKRTTRHLDGENERKHKDHLTYHNDTQDFSEPSSVGTRFHGFVSSTPAFPMNSKSHKVPDTRPTLNILMSEHNNNGAANGNDDNSESSESTSGCSSLIPQNNKQEAPTSANFSSAFTNKRRYIDEKLSFTNHLQSPRSLFLDSTTRETLSSRRPSFNPAMVTNSTLDRSSLASPFYSGNTMFGGANAANLYRRSNSVLSEPPQSYQAPKRTSVQVKPSVEKSVSDLSGMSHTARKILETLEQFSSPLSDARKMPTVRSANSNSSILSAASAASNRKRAREDDPGTPRVGLRHLTRELTVPTVPDILRIKRKQRLQNTTANARKIMSSRGNNVLQPASQEYHLRVEEDEKDKPSKRNHLKAKKKTKLDEEDTIEAVNLPNIPLPISSLPRFDIALPQQQYTAPSTPPQNHKDDSFKFASPIKFNESGRNLESVNDFTFSKPLTPGNDEPDISRKVSGDSSETVPKTSASSFPNFIWSGPTSASPKLKEKEKVEDTKDSPTAPKVASQLRTGSVMDFFAKKPVVVEDDDEKDKWECSECLIKNSGKLTHCVACKSSKQTDSSSDIEIIDVSDDEDKEPAPTKNKKSGPPSKSLPSFNTLKNSQSPMTTKSPLLNSAAKESPKPSTPTLFDKTDNTSTIATLPAQKVTKPTWECPCCMVRNAETALTCPCCNTAKPGSLNSSPKRDTSSTNAKSGFGDMFKKPEGTWTCDTCMIQNKPDVNKCAACETPKPGSAPLKNPSTASTGFGSMFKKPEGSWSCDTCLVQNKAEAIKCAACETPKPGSAPSTLNSQSKSDKPVNTSGFKFGIDKAAESALPKTNGFTFGKTSTSNSSATTGGFTFGAPAKKDDDSTGKFQFGSKPAEEVKANFSFGSTSKAEEKPPAASGFQFGVSKPVEEKPKEENEQKSEVKPITSGFSFGAATKDSEKSTEKDTILQPEAKPTPAPAVNFIFNAPKPAVETTPKETAVETNKKIEENTPKAPLTFGASSATLDSSKPPTSGFSFGSSASENSSSSSTATPSLFSFGSQTTKPNETTSFSAAKPTFSFGKSAESTTPSVTENKAPAINFNTGSNNSATPVASPSFGSQTNATTPSLFGSSTPTTSTTENKPAGLFGAPENKTASAFGSTPSEPSNKLPAFGSTATDKPASSGFGSTFGASSTSVPTLFGNNTPATSAPATTPSFGTASSTPSIFGSVTKPSAAPTAPTPGIFTFGQSSQQKTPAAPTFNFSAGSNATPAATPAASTDQKGIFSFGASSRGPVGNGFGSPAPSNATSSFGSTSTSSFTFNAPPKLDGFGQTAPATTPMFNAPPVTNSVFPNTASPAPATTGFNFGSTNVPSTFNFGSTPSPSTGGFNFNAPSTPSFNFTAGTGGAPVQFNAQPARKIKKAIRRMPRQ